MSAILATSAALLGYLVRDSFFWLTISGTLLGVALWYGLRSARGADAPVEVLFGRRVVTPIALTLTVATAGMAVIGGGDAMAGVTAADSVEPAGAAGVWSAWRGAAVALAAPAIWVGAVGRLPRVARGVVVLPYLWLALSVAAWVPLLPRPEPGQPIARVGIAPSAAGALALSVTPVAGWNAAHATTLEVALDGAIGVGREIAARSPALWFLLPPGVVTRIVVDAADEAVAIVRHAPFSRLRAITEAPWRALPERSRPRRVTLTRRVPEEAATFLQPGRYLLRLDGHLTPAPATP